MTEKVNDSPDVDATPEPTGVEDAMVGDLEKVVFDDPMADEPITLDGVDDQTKDVGEDAPDTTPETDDKSDTKADTGVDPLSTLMEETGLMAKYGTSEKALRALSDAQTELERRGQEAKQYQQVNAQLTEMIRNIRPPAPAEVGLTQDDLDQFMVDPTPEAFQSLSAKAGYVQKSEFDNGMQAIQRLHNTMENQALADDFNDHEDFRDVGRYVRTHNDLPPAGLNPQWDKIMGMVKKFPTLSKVSINELIGAFHQPGSKSSKPDVPLVPPHKKVAATTTSADRTPGNSGVRADGLPINFDSLSVEQQENVLTKMGYFG